MGEMYSEGPVAGTCAESYKQRGPNHGDKLLNTTGHGIHQGRLQDSGDTGFLLKGGNAGRVALIAWSLPKCPSSAGASERPRVLRPVALGAARPGLPPRYPDKSTRVNTAFPLGNSTAGSDRIEGRRLHAQLLAHDVRVVRILLSCCGVCACAAIQAQ